MTTKVLLAAAVLAVAAARAAAQADLDSAFTAARAATAASAKSAAKAAEAKPKTAPRTEADAPLYPELKACEQADWSKTGTSAPAREAGKPLMGWEGRMGPSLVLLTKTAAYYYHEDCDICTEVTRCELSSGKLASVAVAHMVDCADMKPYRSEPGVVYDACATRP